jgi:hypothetical protein
MKQLLCAGILIAGAQLMTPSSSASTLKVVDESDHPVAGALVLVQGMSVQGRSLTTGDDGKVLVDRHEIVGAKWVVVSKAGYESYVIKLDEPWPGVVVLQRQVDP